MDQRVILRPLRFRFTHEPDAEKYGPRDGSAWWVYDEQEIVALPNPRLVELERELKKRDRGLNLLVVMQAVRDEDVLGYHAASWLVIHLAAPEIAGKFTDYEPRTMLIEWERVPDREAAEAPDPLASTSSPSSSPTE